MESIQELITISRFYGTDSRFVIAGGGNTSFKNNENLWVKASGASLATITESGFAIMDRERLNLMSSKKYSKNPVDRESEVKNDLEQATLSVGKRPSVETSMHNVINYSFVVHMHPTAVNGLMCAQNVETDLKSLFGEKALYIEYTDPGYVLFKKVEDAILEYRERHSEEPNIIWLQNHGIFVAANSTQEIKELYTYVLDTLEKAMNKTISNELWAEGPFQNKVLEGLKAIFPTQYAVSLKVRNNALTRLFSDQVQMQQKIAKPFTPDAIVYCKSNYVFLNSEAPTLQLEEAAEKITAFIAKFNYLPKIILSKGIGLVAIGETEAQCEVLLDVFEDAMKIAVLAESFGGEHPMKQQQIDFIDNWEVENYSRSVSEQ